MAGFLARLDLIERDVLFEVGRRLLSGGLAIETGPAWRSARQGKNTFMRSDTVWARDTSAEEHELRVQCHLGGIVSIGDDKMMRILSKHEVAKLVFMLIQAIASPPLQPFLALGSEPNQDIDR